MSRKGRNFDPLNDFMYRRTDLCDKYRKLLLSKDSALPPFTVLKVESRDLNVQWINNNGFSVPTLVENNVELLGLKVPDKCTTLFDISDILGEDTKIRLIEVGTQREDKDWSIGQYANYFHKRDPTAHKIMNLISLEVSSTALSAEILAPMFVRELDWTDMHWPSHRRALGQFPQVQKYCLASMAGAYTDFHIDFGGTSVWYHILWGKKRFYFIEPTAENLHIYGEWICSKNQDNEFLGDMVPKGSCRQIDLYPGQVMFIPGGWIHAVYTPEDSLVFGGNFLLSACIYRQLQVHAIETQKQVSKIYRFPYFKQVCWYAITGVLVSAYTIFIKKLKKDNNNTVALDWVASTGTSLMNFIKQWSLLIKCCTLFHKSPTVEEQVIFEESSTTALLDMINQGLITEMERWVLPIDPSEAILTLWWQILQIFQPSESGSDQYVFDDLMLSEELVASIQDFVNWVKGTDGMDKEWNNNILSPDLEARLQSTEKFQKKYSSYSMESIPLKLRIRRQGNNWVGSGPIEEQDLPKFKFKKSEVQDEVFEKSQLQPKEEEEEEVISDSDYQNSSYHTRRKRLSSAYLYAAEGIQAPAAGNVFILQENDDDSVDSETYVEEDDEEEEIAEEEGPKKKIVRVGETPNQTSISDRKPAISAPKKSLTVRQGLMKRMSASRRGRR